MQIMGTLEELESAIMTQERPSKNKNNDLIFETLEKYKQYGIVDKFTVKELRDYLLK